METFLWHARFARFLFLFFFFFFKSVFFVGKLFRVGYSLEELSKLVHQLLDVKGGHNLDSALQAARSLASAIYWLLDNWYWAQKIELFNVADTAKVNRYRIGFWLSSVLLSLPSAFKAYATARAAVKRDEPKTQQAVNLQAANLVRLGSDVVVAASFAVTAEVLPPLFEVHEGIVGLAGVTSGVAGVYMTLSK